MGQTLGRTRYWIDLPTKLLIMTFRFYFVLKTVALCMLVFE